jgi:hypothetical protein
MVESPSMSEEWGEVSWESLRLGMAGVVMEWVGDVPDMVANYTGRYGRVSGVGGEMVCELDARQQWMIVTTELWLIHVCGAGAA